MTILQHLLSKTLILMALFCGSTFTGPKAAVAETIYCPKEFDVLERIGKKDYQFVKKELEKLFCTNKFEGEHFKIVYATEEEAISFDHENKDLIRKAANVYHHLTIARQFWMKEIKSDYVDKLQQITIRLDIVNAFSNTRHFRNAEQEKNYNNAWSVPEGETPRAAGEKKKWFKEIWFSPMKKIEARKEVKSEGNNPIHESLVLIKDPVVDLNESGLIYTGLNWAKYPAITGSEVLEDAVKRAGTIAVMYALLETTKHVDKWFINKYYFVETAMVPEIIYHEYAHIAMSDTMKTVHSVPVIEGMADYFATRVADRKKMYEELRNFSNNRAKDPNNKDLYHPYLEGSWNATSDFTLSVLWLGRKEFEKANTKRLEKGQPALVNYDELVFSAHSDLNEKSDIANGLNGALIKACKKKCDSVRAGVNTLHYVFEKKGFN